MLSWVFRSAPPSPPPPPPLLDEPWREINWGDRPNALQQVNDYKPLAEGQQLRILLHGAGGAGKSSFINSVQSILRSRMSIEALADNISRDCFTKQYMSYKIQKGSPETFYPFVFNDLMGLSKDKGVLEDDIKLSLKGHVKDGYNFNPETKLSEGDQFYNDAPTNNDKVHVLVCVVAADTLSLMSEEVKKKIRDIRLEASRLGIPQVVVLTKVDQGCPEVEKDLRNVYRSKSLQKQMEQFSVDVGFPMNCIFPVKNYHKEIDLSDDADALTLRALKHIIDFGDDFINRRLHNIYREKCAEN